MRSIHRHGRPVAGGPHPLICIRLLGRTRDALLGELAIALAKKPDIIEWRVDCFAALGDTAQVIDVAAQIRSISGKTPIIFTCRSMDEGGERIALDDTDVMKLYVAACASRCIDLIDYELSNSAENLARLRNASRDNEVAMIMSYHNVVATPDPERLTAIFLDAERLGADIAKVAVTAAGPDDVLTLLDATSRASKLCAIPLIALSTGDFASFSHLIAWVCGSTVAFAFGLKSRTPVELSIDDLRVALASLQQTRRADGAAPAACQPGAGATLNQHLTPA